MENTTNTTSTELEQTAETTQVAEYKGGQLNYLDGKELNRVYKNAMALAQSDLLPETYRGKPANVMIAMDIASRMPPQFGIMNVMQNLYIVKGHPSWSGQFCLAAIKASGKYANVKYVWVGENQNDPNFGCFLQATDIATGETVKGTTVDWKMVKAYGWNAKTGSQWLSNPEQMFKYRAAAYFARTECPEVLMGIHTADEMEDVYGRETAEKKEKVVITLNDNDVEVVNNG